MRNSRDDHARTLRDAAIQQRFMRHRQSDYVKNNNEQYEIIYAVDSDIFFLYGGSEMRNDENIRNLDYGYVFWDDPGEDAQIIASRLVDYIFIRLTKNNVPLLIVPPIEYEVSAIIKGISKDVELRFQEILNEMRDRREKMSDISSDDYALFKKALFSLNDPLTRLNNLTYLVKTSRIVPSTEISKVTKNCNAISIIENSAPQNVSEKLRLQSIWESNFLAIKKQDRKQLDIHDRRDAEALATLEFWNNQLDRHKIKIVYITGSFRVFKAAWMLHGEEFVQKFIRHPRAFLGDESVLLTSGGNFKDMLRIFLVDSENETRYLDGFSLSNIGEDIIDTATDQMFLYAEKTKEEWKNYRNALDRESIPTQPILERARALFRKNYEEWEEMHQDIESALQDMLTKSWKNCFDAAISAGWLFRKNFGQPLLSPPILRFVSLPDIQEFINSLATEMYLENSDDEYVRDYEKKLEKIKGIAAGNNYYYYLANAALFAGKCDWKAAASLAKSAISCVTNSESDYIDGREAYYLKAMALRRAMTHPFQLKKARKMLKKAVSIYNQEVKYRKNFDVIPERFLMEGIACKISENLFYQFCREESDREPTFNYCRLLSKTEKVFNACISRINGMPVFDDVESICQRDKTILDILNRTCYRSAINVILLHVILGDENLLNLAKKRSFIDAHGFINRDIKYEFSMFSVMSVLDERLKNLANIVMEDNPVCRKKLIDSELLFFDDLKEKKLVFPYDKPLADFIADKLSMLRYFL